MGGGDTLGCSCVWHAGGGGHSLWGGNTWVRGPPWGGGHTGVGDPWVWGSAWGGGTLAGDTPHFGCGEHPEGGCTLGGYEMAAPRHAGCPPPMPPSVSLRRGGSGAGAGVRGGDAGGGGPGQGGGQDHRTLPPPPPLQGGAGPPRRPPPRHLHPPRGGTLQGGGHLRRTPRPRQPLPRGGPAAPRPLEGEALARPARVQEREPAPPLHTCVLMHRTRAPHGRLARMRAVARPHCPCVLLARSRRLRVLLHARSRLRCTHRVCATWLCPRCPYTCTLLLAHCSLHTPPARTLLVPSPLAHLHGGCPCCRCNRTLTAGVPAPCTHASPARCPPRPLHARCLGRACRRTYPSPRSRACGTKPSSDVWFPPPPPP